MIDVIYWKFSYTYYVVYVVIHNNISIDEKTEGSYMNLMWHLKNKLLSPICLLAPIVVFSSSAHAYYVQIQGEVTATGAIFPARNDYVQFDTGQQQLPSVSQNAVATVNNSYGSTTTTFNAVAYQGHLSAYASGDVQFNSGTTAITEVRGWAEWNDTITITNGGLFSFTTTLTSTVSGGPCLDLNNDGMDCSQTAANLYTNFNVPGYQPYSIVFTDQLGDGNQLQQTQTWTTTLTLAAGDQFDVTQRLLVPLLGYSTHDVSVSGIVDAFNTGVFTLDPVTQGASYTSQSGVSYISAVPVPTAIWLFGSGLLGLVGIARRKKAA